MTTKSASSGTRHDSFLRRKERFGPGRPQAVGDTATQLLGSVRRAGGLAPDDSEAVRIGHDGLEAELPGRRLLGEGPDRGAAPAAEKGQDGPLRSHPRTA